MKILFDGVLLMVNGETIGTSPFEYRQRYFAQINEWQAATLTDYMYKMKLSPICPTAQEIVNGKRVNA